MSGASVNIVPGVNWMVEKRAPWEFIVQLGSKATDLTSDATNTIAEYFQERVDILGKEPKGKLPEGQVDTNLG